MLSFVSYHFSYVTNLGRTLSLNTMYLTPYSKIRCDRLRFHVGGFTGMACDVSGFTLRRPKKTVRPCHLLHTVVDKEHRACSISFPQSRCSKAQPHKMLPIFCFKDGCATSLSVLTGLVQNMNVSDHCHTYIFIQKEYKL